MKKLMIAAALISAAVVSFGGAVTWDAGTITDADGNTAGKGQVLGYVFQIDSAAYTTYAALDAAKLSQQIYSAYSASLSSAAGTGSSTKKGALGIEAIDATAGTPVYAAILYLDDTIGENTYFMGNVATVTWSGTGTPSVGELANFKLGDGVGSSSNPTSWQVESVPEPFSGALALIGMAGIALRRKMKKAKKA